MDVVRSPSLTSDPTSVRGWLLPLTAVGRGVDPRSAPVRLYRSMKTGTVTPAVTAEPLPRRTTSNEGVTHVPAPSQIAPPLSLRAVPCAAWLKPHVVPVQTGTMQAVVDAGQPAAVVHCGSQLTNADIVVKGMPAQMPLSGSPTVAVTVTCEGPGEHANVVFAELALPNVPPPAGLTLQVTDGAGPMV